ncbi:MAG TPA: hypothetical protein VFN56_04405, partial [Candidatus Saccharimonadales bacterium]|nr:hypothetical protein [Candidatus Saccharimonadales bacterium]
MVKKIERFKPDNSTQAKSTDTSHSKNDRETKKEILPISTMPSAFGLFKPSYNAVLRNLNTFLLLSLVPSMYLLFISLWERRSGVVKIGSTGTAVIHWNSTTIIMYCIAAAYSLLILGALPYAQLKAVRGNSIEFKDAVQS